MTVPSDTEAARAERWLQSHFQPPFDHQANLPPFSFLFDGRPFAEDLSAWEMGWGVLAQPSKDNQALCFTRGEVSCRWNVTFYHDFPAVEWVGHFRNDGSEDSPIIEMIKPLDTIFAVGSAACKLHHARGSSSRVDDFEPLETALDGQSAVRLASTGGRSSNGTLPFFNLEFTQPGEQPWGVIGAVGWSGNWAAEFERAESGELRVIAGMPETRLRLHPGEEIRTPRILLLFWEGDRYRGHNMLRQFLLKHHTPTCNGQPVEAPTSFVAWGENTTERQLAKVRWFADNDIKIDNFWIDAGWHGDGERTTSATVFNSPWWRHVGDWWPNAGMYPEGLTPIGKAACDAGMRFTLWLEPERVHEGTSLTREHSDWLLRLPQGMPQNNFLFDLGNAAARQFLTDKICKLIEDSGISCYRQDFNIDPDAFWKAADAPDRVGMSEIRYIEGLYGFWDDLLARNPGLIIDNCSSGGRRIDLETISRSIALWRSDYQCTPGFDPIGMQGQTHGLALWLPMTTPACDTASPYNFRSALGAGCTFITKINWTGEPEGFFTPWEEFSPEWLRAAVDEQRRFRKYFLGDFYPLLSYSLSPELWAAWQFDRPDLGEGIVLALRRPGSPYTRMSMCLRNLDPCAKYQVLAGGHESAFDLLGQDLLDGALCIDIEDRPGTEIFLYKRC